MKPSTKRVLVDVAAFFGGWLVSDVLVTGTELVSVALGRGRTMTEVKGRLEGKAVIVGAAAPAVAYLARESEAWGLFASGLGTSAAHALFVLQHFGEAA